MPVGYLEMQDCDFPMECVDSSLSGTALWDWNYYMVEGAAKFARPVTNMKKFPGWMRDFGFVIAKQETVHWPMNPWPKDSHLKRLGLWF